MKKMITLALTCVLMLGVLASCGGKNPENTTPQNNPGSGDTSDSTSAPDKTGMTGNITVISREESSGTRGAFIELMGIEDEDGDHTTEMAEISNSTSVVLQTVAQNKNAIGYISLGSLDASLVKAIKVNGVEATVDNINAGTYMVSRPFILATNGTLSAVAQDFIQYILSSEGQAIVKENGYIQVQPAGAYQPAGQSGKITLAGSTSVSPVMEKLADAYKKLNPDVSIEIQQNGSGAGIQALNEGACDIGMSSRELKDSEKAAGAEPIIMALDGIAVIVNPENSIDGLTSEQIRSIFTGEVTKWQDVSE